MSDAIVADTTPIKMTLTEGERYAFCACGRSENQPFCDGSHSGTGITPKVFNAAETGDAFLCRCKGTANAPYCDGTHKQYSAADVGNPVG